jgi:hypothetical protein
MWMNMLLVQVIKKLILSGIKYIYAKLVKITVMI